MPGQEKNTCKIQRVRECVASLEACEQFSKLRCEEMEALRVELENSGEFSNTL